MGKLRESISISLNITVVIAPGNKAAVHAETDRSATARRSFSDCNSNRRGHRMHAHNYGQLKRLESVATVDFFRYLSDYSDYFHEGGVVNENTDS